MYQNSSAPEHSFSGPRTGVGGALSQVTAPGELHTGLSDTLTFWKLPPQAGRCGPVSPHGVPGVASGCVFLEKTLKPKHTWLVLCLPCEVPTQCSPGPRETAKLSPCSSHWPALVGSKKWEECSPQEHSCRRPPGEVSGTLPLIRCPLSDPGGPRDRVSPVAVIPGSLAASAALRGPQGHWVLCGALERWPQRLARQWQASRQALPSTGHRADV